MIRLFQNIFIFRRIKSEVSSSMESACLYYTLSQGARLFRIPLSIIDSWDIIHPSVNYTPDECFQGKLGRLILCGSVLNGAMTRCQIMGFPIKGEGEEEGGDDSPVK